MCKKFSITIVKCQNYSFPHPKNFFKMHSFSLTNLNPVSYYYYCAIMYYLDTSSVFPASVDGQYPKNRQESKATTDEQTLYLL